MKMNILDLRRFIHGIDEAIERRREILAPDHMAGDPRVPELLSEMGVLEDIKRSCHQIDTTKKWKPEVNKAKRKRVSPSK